MPVRRLIVLAAVITVLLSVPGHAADKTNANAKALTIELNTITAVKSACRVTFLIANKLGVPIGDLAFELVLFGKDQKVLTLLGVRAGRLPIGKSRVKQFDLKAIKCANVSRLLLNDVTRCEGKDLNPEVCLAAVKPTSRLNVGFVF